MLNYCTAAVANYCATEAPVEIVLLWNSGQRIVAHDTFALARFAKKNEQHSTFKFMREPSQCLRLALTSAPYGKADETHRQVQ